jgi:hypothetical protein
MLKFGKILFAIKVAKGEQVLERKNESFRLVFKFVRKEKLKEINSDFTVNPELLSRTPNLF